MSRPIYLTARCTRGCELWGSPEEIAAHVTERRCSGVAWFRRPLSTVFVPAGYANVLELSAAGHLLVRRPRCEGSHFEPYERSAGGTLRSPIEGVGPRLWWLTVKRHLDAGSPIDSLLADALDERTFPSLVPDELSDALATCERCGEVVAGVTGHQRTSRRCIAADAANRVCELWDRGYRDPWTAQDRPPLTWNELRVTRWKSRVVLVELPQANAVLLAPIDVRARPESQSSHHQGEQP